MTAPSVFSLSRGTTPLLLSIPHSGTELPPELVPRLTRHALTLPDTDWHVPRLYEFATSLGASILKARYSRYLVDLNRPPSNESLYPGQPTTELCPTLTFDGEPLYNPGALPKDREIEERRRRYWDPYHEGIRAVLADLRSRFGYALLYDCHSIRSVVPRLFDGQLPDLNLGTARGTSCATALRDALSTTLSATPEYSSVVDGRFVGGHITRAFGRPSERVHAVQMEITQINYMLEAPPFTYLPAKAASLGAALSSIIDAVLAWRPQ